MTEDEAIWGPDDPTVRLRPPVDPWAGAHDGNTQEITGPVPAKRGRVYGRVYEVFTTRPDIDGPHPYAGQTTTTIHQRVHGPSGHTSPGEVAKAPWKARIKPGRAGYRQLKVIYATGDPAADQVRLDMAEAFAIDELRTTYNTQRPIRSPGTPPRRRVEPAPVRPLTDRQRAIRRAERRRRARVTFCLLFVTLFTVLWARILLRADLASPVAPWVGAPIGGLLCGWFAFWYVLRLYRRLTR